MIIQPIVITKASHPAIFPNELASLNYSQGVLWHQCHDITTLGNNETGVSEFITVGKQKAP